MRLTDNLFLVLDYEAKACDVLLLSKVQRWRRLIGMTILTKADTALSTPTSTSDTVEVSGSSNAILIDVRAVLLGA